MLAQSQIKEFEKMGYVAGGKVLDDAEVEVLCSEVLRVIDERSRTDIPQPVMCHNMGKPEARYFRWCGGAASGGVPTSQRPLPDGRGS